MELNQSINHKYFIQNQNYNEYIGFTYAKLLSQLLRAIQCNGIFNNYDPEYIKVT